MQKMAGGSKVGVADFTSRPGSAATPTLRGAAATTMPGVEVGVPDYVVATSFARTSTRPAALAEWDVCFVDVLLPPRFWQAKHSSPAEGVDGEGVAWGKGEMGLGVWTRVRSLRSLHTPTHTTFMPNVTKDTLRTPPSFLALSPCATLTTFRHYTN